MGMYVCDRCVEAHDLEVDPRKLEVRGMCELCRARLGMRSIEWERTRWVVEPNRNVQLPFNELWGDYWRQLVLLRARRECARVVRASDGMPLRYGEDDENTLVRFQERSRSMTLDWFKDYDDEDNEVWSAASPYHDEGSPFYFRIQEISGTGTFKLASDAELMLGEHEKMRFASLEEAKSLCQKDCDEIIAEIEKVVGE
jgi:hypothetical protein